MSIPQVLCIVGARPNFMKIAPIMRAFKSHPQVTASLLHTGQHYDAAMKASFFEQLGIPEPDVDLGVGSGSHAEQTANIMLRFEPELERLAPDAVLVVGDVNSTLACALVASKRHIPVVHVEAGLRSNDRKMPEEINRLLVDQLSDLLFTTEIDAQTNLTREGICAKKVGFVGNVMIDSLRHSLPAAIDAAETLAGAGSLAEGYTLLTMHRPSNVDDPKMLMSLLDLLFELHQQSPVVFPVHPRTLARIESLGYLQKLKDAGMVLLGPQSYLVMLGLMRDAKMVLTDSGGIQEETTALGVPCLTLRESTERPITVSEGTNTIVGTNADVIRTEHRRILETGGKAGRQPELWDGKAAERIVERLAQWLGGTNPS